MCVENVSLSFDTNCKGFLESVPGLVRLFYINMSFMISRLRHLVTLNAQTPEKNLMALFITAFSAANEIALK